MNVQTFLLFKGVCRDLTARTVAAMPEDKMAFSPAPNSRSFVEIVLHILETDHMFINMISGQKLKPEKDFTAENFPTRKSLVDSLRAQGDQVQRVIASVSAEQFQTTSTSPFGMLSAEDCLAPMLMHEAEHRGNLVIIAKLCGVTPPDIVQVHREQGH